MKQLKWLISLLLAFTLIGCLHDHDEDDHDHDSDDAALVADVCNHLANGPFSDVTDEIHGELAHKTWKIQLTASGDTYQKTIGLHPEEGEDHDHGAKVSAAASEEKIEVTLFADNAMTVAITKAGVAVAAESEVLDIDECPLMKYQVTYELEVGTEYQLAITGATSENVMIAFAEHGGDHDH